MGAGDVEWLSDWANVDFGEAFDHYYFGKTPLEDPELYIQKSPLFKMDRVKTPTLIFFGTNDRQVPTEARLDALSRAVHDRQSSGEIHFVSRRSARAAEVDAPASQSE